MLDIFSIDASEEDSCLARWVNDDHIHPNCVIKKVTFNQSSGSSLPHLCLFALVDLRPGVELRYDYGVGNLPWRQVHILFCLFSYIDFLKGGHKNG